MTRREFVVIAEPPTPEQAAAMIAAAAPIIASILRWYRKEHQAENESVGEIAEDIEEA